MKTEEILRSLKQQVTLPVHSTRELVGKVEEAAADKEHERYETFQKRQEEGSTKPADTYIRPPAGNFAFPPPTGASPPVHGGPHHISLPRPAAPTRFCEDTNSCARQPSTSPHAD